MHSTSGHVPIKKMQAYAVPCVSCTTLIPNAYFTVGDLIFPHSPPWLSSKFADIDYNCYFSAGFMVITFSFCPTQGCCYTILSYMLITHEANTLTYNLWNLCHYHWSKYIHIISLLCSSRQLSRTKCTVLHFTSYRGSRLVITAYFC